MARGRMLNTTIAKDKQLNDLGIEAEYIYLKTIPHLDRDGLINGDPALLWADVCPRRPELMPRMQDLINEIVASGLVISYHCPLTDDTVLFFVGFSKNNTGMHYGREAKSQFSLPPGFKRTNSGLKPVGEPDETESEPKTRGSSHDGDSHEYEVNPDELRSSSGLSPGEDQVKDQDQIEDQGGSTRARVTDGQQPTQPPPSAAQHGEYMPGLPDPRQKANQQRESVAERFLEAKKLGVTAEQYRTMVDALLVGFGKKAMVDAGNDKTLYFAQDLTLRVMRMSEKFRSVGGIESIFASWYVDDWRGRKGEKPTSEQLEEHASAMADGVICKAQEQAKPPLTFKQWCQQEYNTDIPQVALGLPLERLQQKYEQAIRVH